MLMFINANGIHGIPPGAGLRNIQGVEPPDFKKYIYIYIYIYYTYKFFFVSLIF